MFLLLLRDFATLGVLGVLSSSPFPLFSRKILVKQFSDLMPRLASMSQVYCGMYMYAGIESWGESPICSFFLPISSLQKSFFPVKHKSMNEWKVKLICKNILLEKCVKCLASREMRNKFRAPPQSPLPPEKFNANHLDFFPPLQVVCARTCYPTTTPPQMVAQK